MPAKIRCVDAILMRIEWPGIIGAGVALLLLVALFVRRGRRRGETGLPGQLDGDRFTSWATGKRGLHGMTKWG